MKNLKNPKNKKTKVISSVLITPFPKVIVYQTKTGALELRGDTSLETVWANQAQIAEIFNVERSVVTKHLGNILKSEEVLEKSNVQKMHIANSDKPVSYYSLDVILAVGYRANTGKAIEFRRWASGLIKSYLKEGYTLNKKVILRNYDTFMKNVGEIQSLLPAHATFNPKMVIELVKEYAVTWSRLDAYDKDELKKEGITKKKISLSGGELLLAIQELKHELLVKKEATEIFAQERMKGSAEGILGNVMQSFDGKDVYLTLEEKAAHLLYFMVKNHPFVDGNKRSGAFAFIWFLRRFGVKGASSINQSGLTVMTLLIAESDPTHKERVVALVVSLLRG